VKLAPRVENPEDLSWQGPKGDPPPFLGVVENANFRKEAKGGCIKPQDYARHQTFLAKRISCARGPSSRAVADVVTVHCASRAQRFY
jgi:hypothetical protein